MIAASKSAAPTNPHWYHNLRANPEATVEAGGETFQARATEVTGAERDRLYDQHAEERPEFKDYPNKTTRVIPVFTLERVELRRTPHQSRRTHSSSPSTHARWPGGMATKQPGPAIVSVPSSVR